MTDRDDFSHLRIQEYSAGAPEKVGLWRGLADAARVFRQNRWQVRVQFSRTLRGRFSRSYLGVFWALVLPVVPVSAYLFLRLLFAPAATNGMHPAVYVGLGVTFWFLMAGAMQAPMQALQRQAGTLSRSHFPVSVAIACESMEALFDTFIRLLFLLPFLFWLAQPSLLGVLYGMLALVVMFLFATGVGCFLMLLTLAVPDTRTVVDVLMRYLIFLSLAIFPLPANVWGDALSIGNPLAVLIDNARLLLVHGEFASPQAFAVVTLAALLAFFCGCYFVHVSERHVRGLL